MTELPTISTDVGTLLFYCISGSRAYGTSRHDSDTDYRGVFGWGLNNIVGLSDPKDTLTDSSLGDCHLYSLRMTLNYALSGKFGMVESLFNPAESILYTNPAFQIVLDNRDALLSKQWFNGILGYFKSQRYSLANKGTGSSLGRLRDKFRVGPVDIVEEQYDGKFALHAIRLANVGLDLAKTGTIHVRRPEPEAKFLLQVLDGSAFETRSRLVSYLSDLEDQLVVESAKSSLREQPDYSMWDSIYRGIEKSL